MVVDTQLSSMLVLGNPNYFDRESLTPYLGLTRWPHDSDSIEHVTITHLLEYIPGPQRIAVINELWRVLKVGGKAMLKLPYWSSPNAVADPYLVWPPFNDMSLQYLADAEFRQRNNLNYPQLRSNFYFGPPGLSFAPDRHIRGDDMRDYEIHHHLSVVSEMTCTLTKLALAE